MTLSIQATFWNHPLLLVGCLALLLSGCIGLDAYPIAARAGDTITLPLGSPERMARNNTSVLFEDSEGNIHDLTGDVRAIFKLYPDRASKAWDSSGTVALVSSALHEPWLTVMALDLPASLPVGTGTLRVTSSADYPEVSAHINAVPLRLEILPGAGVSNPLEYVLGTTASSTATGDLRALEPRTTVTINNTSRGTNLYGAIEIKARIGTTKGVQLSPSHVRVIMEDLTVVSESRRTWFWDMDNGEDYTVVLISPEGWLADYEAHFKVVFKQAAIVGTPTITSVRYFDLNGAEVVGPPAEQYTVIVDNGYDG